VLNFTIKPVIYGSLAACALSVPVINTITGLGTAFIKDSWITKIVERLYRKALPRSNHVLFQNSDDLDLFREHNLLGTVPTGLVAGSGVDLSEPAVVPVPHKGPVTFLLIARLLRDKGVEEFVEAAHALKTHYPDAPFQLLGPLGVANRTAIAEEQLQQWVTDVIVEYLGSTDDVRPFIAKAHCVVLPSYREGMPRVLLEAAADGTPAYRDRCHGMPGGRQARGERLSMLAP
jgi:glycosyltransferase involved in cell wall biosynthesis